jgi:hypothetical protein
VQFDETLLEFHDLTGMFEACVVAGLPDDFFEPLELIQAQQHAIPSGPLFECVDPIPRGFQRRVPQSRQRLLNVAFIAPREDSRARIRR